MTIRVQTAVFDPAAELAAFGAANPGAGAVVSFLGTVRATAEDGHPLEALVLEHYPGMCEQRLGEIVAAARSRWSIRASLIVHRVGRLVPGEDIVLTAIASNHRGDAFASCAFIVDLLKTEAPFWKQELTAEGGRWLVPKPIDEQRAAAWGRE